MNAAALDRPPSGTSRLAGAHGASWREMALCAQFRATGRTDHDGRPVKDPQLDLLVDRMWGLEDGDDPGDRDLRRGAKRVCGVCPVRMRCLATAIVGMEQRGIYGGLDLHERRRLARIMRDYGVFDPQAAGHERVKHTRRYDVATMVDWVRVRDLAPGLAEWLERHADVLAYVAALETARRRRQATPPPPASLADGSGPDDPGPVQPGLF